MEPYRPNYYNATGVDQVGYSEWRDTYNATIVTLTSPSSIFKSGMKVTIKTPDKDFTGTIQNNHAAITNATPYIFLDKGVDYTNGARISGGTIAPAIEPIIKAQSVAEAVTKGGLNLVWVGLAAVAAYFMFFKKGKKGKK